MPTTCKPFIIVALLLVQCFIAIDADARRGSSRFGASDHFEYLALVKGDAKTLADNGFPARWAGGQFLFARHYKKRKAGLGSRKDFQGYAVTRPGDRHYYKIDAAGVDWLQRNGLIPRDLSKAQPNLPGVRSLTDLVTSLPPWFWWLLGGVIVALLLLLRVRDSRRRKAAQATFERVMRATGGEFSTILHHILVSVAGADGNVSSSEQQVIQRVLGRAGARESFTDTRPARVARADLTAFLELVRTQLDDQQRNLIAHSIGMVIAADGKVTLSEKRLLRRYLEAIGVDPKQSSSVAKRVIASARQVQDAAS